MHTHHLPALGFLFAMIVMAITLGATAKTGIVKRMNIFFTSLSSIVFGFAFYFAIMMAFDHRGFWAITTVLCFVDCVFFLGAMIVCNQDIEFENGGLIIKKRGLLYRMIFNKPMGMKKRSEDLTLCSISWFGMLAIAFYPVFYIGGHVIAAIIAIVCFLFAAQNPLLQNKWWHDTFANDYQYDKAWETLYLGPIPFSPLLIAFILSLLGILVYSLGHLPWIGWWFLVQIAIVFVLSMVILLPILYLIALRLDRAEAALEGKPLPEYEQRTVKVLLAPRAIIEAIGLPFIWMAKGIMACFDPIATLIRAFKKVACPTIILKK